MRGAAETVCGAAHPTPGSSPGQALPLALEDDGQPAGDREPTREILFLDPRVADIETLLGHLRPEVEAILLDPVRPAARQIAAAVAGRRGLDAVHVIAHGAPGRVSFAAGDWSAATLEEEAEDLAAIGQALGAGRNVNLWSCQTAAGPAGAAFIAGLARASGADIAAATGRVGAAALGGGWELAAAAQPPLTAAGIAVYVGVMVAKTWVGGGSPNPTDWNQANNWSPSGVPASGDTVTIGATTNSPTLSASTTVTSVTINGTDTLTLSGAGTTLTATSGITLSNASATISGAGNIAAATTISGFGVVILNLTGTGTVTASGGVLDLVGSVSGRPLQIATSSAASILKLEGTVSSNVSFLTPATNLGTLDFPTPTALQNFSGTITGLNIGGSITTATNQLDFGGRNFVSASLNGTTLTVVDSTGQSYALTLGAAPAAGTLVDLKSDGAGGTDAFLSTPAATDTFTAANTVNSWQPGSGHSWNTNPTQTPAAGTNLVFLNTTGTSSGQSDPTNYIYMPPTLRQATGSGSSVWTISDTNGSPTQFVSTLILDNEGQIFVNGTNNFASGTASINWTVTGAAAGATTGNEYFENDGTINVVGGTGITFASATFSGNVALLGSGSIDLYGNAALVIGSGVGVAGGQTFDFVTDSNGITNGQINAQRPSRQRRHWRLPDRRHGNT